MHDDHRVGADRLLRRHGDRRRHRRHQRDSGGSGIFSAAPAEGRGGAFARRAEAAAATGAAVVISKRTAAVVASYSSFCVLVGAEGKLRSLDDRRGARVERREPRVGRELHLRARQHREDPREVLGVAAVPDLIPEHALGGRQSERHAVVGDHRAVDLVRGRRRVETRAAGLGAACVCCCDGERCRRDQNDRKAITAVHGSPDCHAREKLDGPDPASGQPSEMTRRRLATATRIPSRRRPGGRSW